MRNVGVTANAVFVGAALCRERGAKRPQDFCTAAHIAGAALQPFRDTRPLLHRAQADRICTKNKKARPLAGQYTQRSKNRCQGWEFVKPQATAASLALAWLTPFSWNSPLMFRPSAWMKSTS
ncbi:hypothetical protein B7H18_29835 [Pseudomonas putida]|nr:hypothetical protein B7H18_29835 [Pseudomonas putida]